jgi:hypothetical protein
MCSGLFLNAAKKDPEEGYRTLAGSRVVYTSIHPSSALFNCQLVHEFLLFYLNVGNSSPINAEQSGRFLRVSL